MATHLRPQPITVTVGDGVFGSNEEVVLTLTQPSPSSDQEATIILAVVTNLRAD